MTIDAVTLSVEQSNLLVMFYSLITRTIILLSGEQMINSLVVINRLTHEDPLER